jgi:hypothetical protein
MVVGMRGLTILNDCLRYSLGPPEKVLLIRYNKSIFLFIVIELAGVMILEGNV